MIFYGLVTWQTQSVVDFYLTRDEVIVSFMNAPASGGVALALQFRGANLRPALEGEQRAAGEVHYFRGNDPAAWPEERHDPPRSLSSAELISSIDEPAPCAAVGQGKPAP